MSGFGGFGRGAFGGFFGSNPPEQPGFASPTTTTTTTSTTTTTTVTTTGLTFGSPGLSSGTTGLFGAKPQTSGFGTSFGSKPPTGGCWFVTSTNTLKGFGNTTLPATTAPTFGVPSTSTALGFGIPASTTSGLGAPTTTNSTFGVPSTTQSTFGSFGTGFTFKPTSTTTTTTSKPTTGFTTNTTAAFNFNITTSSAAAPLSFGIQTTAAGTTATITTTSSTLTFGVSGIANAAVTQATGFNLSQPTSTTITSVTTASAATTTTASLTFGTLKTTGGFTFGIGTTTTPLGTGLFGAAKTVVASAGTTTTTVTTVGLGGIDNKQTTQGLSGKGTLEPKHIKDNVLPEPIMQTLNEFQNFTKQQKSISVEISHGSSKPLKKVQEDTEAMESLLTTIASGLTRNAIAVDRLKTETAQGLHQAEMAQRNHETPPGLEYDNSAPFDYFNDLVTKFETDTVRLRVQVEAAEKHLRSLMQSSTISPQELTLAMRRLHETLIVLAARVQALHMSVQSQKEQFKNLRRVYFKDEANIFENDTDQSFIKKQTIYSMRSLTGPTPFSENPGIGPSLHVDGLAMLASSAGASTPATSSNPSWMSPLQNTTNMPSLLPNTNLFGGFQLLELPEFQLSKPPPGNKRSRR